MAKQTVELAPSESKVVSFETTPTVAKTYNVVVNGLTGSFKATEAPVEVIDFELTKPTVSPATITPGTAITITCPVTSRCTKLQNIIAKVIIYEGSIPPGHGARIVTKTSPSFSISPGETYNVIVHHTAIVGTIDRRDVEVEIWMSPLIVGNLVKESEWDDVYYVVPPALNWEAFGQCLGGFSPEYIADGVGLASCMEAKNLPEPLTLGYNEFRQVYGNALKQCGIEHPEYLTDSAKSIPTPRRSLTNIPDFEKRYGIYPYVCLTISSDWTDLHVDELGWIPDAGDVCWYTIIWKVTWWYRFPHGSACHYCKGALIL